MKIKVKSNLACGILSTVFALALWFAIPLQVIDYSNKMIKSDFLPKLIAIIIFACGVWLIVQAIRKPEKDKTIEFELKREGRVVIYMAALLLYMFLFERIGFFFSSELLALFTLAFIKDKKPLHYGIVAVYVAVIFFVFKYALGVPFPTLFVQ